MSFKDFTNLFNKILIEKTPEIDINQTQNTEAPEENDFTGSIFDIKEKDYDTDVNTKDTQNELEEFFDLLGKLTEKNIQPKIDSNEVKAVDEIIQNIPNGGIFEIPGETFAHIKTGDGEYEELNINRTEEHTRAYIKVQDGCNQFCSYCLIPFARGRIRSRKTAQVVAEVIRLAQSGCQEVVLTGIHLSSYGMERKEDGETLLTLIQAIHEVKGINRIRLGSLEPGIITEDFVSAIAQLPKVCPHFHLSLQSGCTETLKRMNRRYTAEEYKERCELLRKYYAAPALTTDVIVGFPGETEEEFLVSREFVEQIHFYETHIFPYSKREGTRAAVMSNQISESVKKERSRILIELGKAHQSAYMEQFVGIEKEVLFEEQQELDGAKYWVGHTMEYLKVAVISGENLDNICRNVKLEAIYQGEILLGTLV